MYMNANTYELMIRTTTKPLVNSMIDEPSRILKFSYGFTIGSADS